jgi:F-type H+-transporting ATPase subunit b
MLIDWFTVLAQIVNFLVLVWLLKHFLYGRILRAIDARETRIAEDVAAAETMRAEAQAQLAEYQARLAALEEQRETVLAEARADAERQHAAMLERARRDVRDRDTKWKEDLEREHETFLLNLRRRAATEILGITRRLITDLTSTDLEQCATELFLRKLRSLDREIWSRFAGHALLVRTARELPDDQRTRIRQEIESCCGTPVELRFEHTAGVGLGLELRGNGWCIGWTSEAYLDTLQEDLNEALSEGCGTRSVAEKATV